MSQSNKVSRSFGSISLRRNADFKTGSSTTVSVKSVPAQTVLADANATLTIDQLKSGLLVMTPTSSRSLTTPIASAFTSFLKNVGDSFEFTVINLGADTNHITLVGGTNVSTVGFLVVRDSDATGASDTGSARFRVRASNVSTGTEAVTLYRV